jgi:hypothetical protein
VPSHRNEPLTPTGAERQKEKGQMSNWHKTNAELWTRADGARVQKKDGLWQCSGPMGDLLWELKYPGHYKRYASENLQEAMAEVDEAWPTTPTKGAAR